MMRIKARVVTLPHSLAPTNMCDARVRGQRAALCGERWRAHGKEQPWGEVARTMAAWLATRERRGACRILLPLRAGRRVRCSVLPAYGCMWLLVLSRTPITLSSAQLGSTESTVHTEMCTLCTTRPIVPSSSPVSCWCISHAHAQGSTDSAKAKAHLRHLMCAGPCQRQHPAPPDRARYMQSAGGGAIPAASLATQRCRPPRRRRSLAALTKRAARAAAARGARGGKRWLTERRRSCGCSTLAPAVSARPPPATVPTPQRAANAAATGQKRKRKGPTRASPRAVRGPRPHQAWRRR